MSDTDSDEDHKRKPPTYDDEGLPTNLNDDARQRILAMREQLDKE